MGFQNAVQFMGLTREATPKGKHRANGMGICLEQGEERASKTETLDRSKSDLNIYQGYESGRECWNDMVKRANEHKTKVKMTNKKTGEEYYRERSVRSDAVIGCAMIFNPSPEMCVGWSNDDFDKFREDAFGCVCDFNKIYKEQNPDKKIPIIFRKENVRMISRHWDEGIHESDAHDHMICDCIDENGEYNGNIIDARFLSEFNKVYPQMMRQKGWDIDDLDTTDWDKFKNDKEYRQERKQKIKNGSLSCNQHNNVRLKNEMLKATAVAIDVVNQYQEKLDFEAQKHYEFSKVTFDLSHAKQDLKDTQSLHDSLLSQNISLNSEISTKIDVKKNLDATISELQKNVENGQNMLNNLNIEIEQAENNKKKIISENQKVTEELNEILEKKQKATEELNEILENSDKLNELINNVTIHCQKANAWIESKKQEKIDELSTVNNTTLRFTNGRGDLLDILTKYYTERGNYRDFEKDMQNAIGNYRKTIENSVNETVKPIQDPAESKIFVDNQDEIKRAIDYMTKKRRIEKNNERVEKAENITNSDKKQNANHNYSGLGH